MFKVALIGAGQLGSRHLQSLAKVGVPVSLEVVDPSASSLALANNRLSEVGSNSNVRGIRFLQTIERLPSDLDFCVVATGADVRLEVLKALLSATRVRYLVLEKVLFQSVAQLDEARELIEKSQVKVWVNCPRRLFPIYRQIKEMLTDAPLMYRLTGGGWGLACNGIHFIDHLAWLAGERLASLDTTGLHPGSIESKRQGYVEVAGTLRGLYDGGSRIELTCTVAAAPMYLQIESTDVRISVEEGAGLATVSRSATGWKEEILSFGIPFQSELTHVVATELFETGSCGLTPFLDSAGYHTIFLDAMGRHLGLKECPIT